MTWKNQINCLNIDVSEDPTVSDLLSQLSGNFPKKVKAADDIDLSPDNLEEFVLKYAGQLVKDSIESVEGYKDIISGGGTAEEAEALAALIKSAGTGIDVLQKIMTTREKNSNSREIAQMKIDSQQIQTDKEISAKVLISREEAMVRLFQSIEPTKSNIIDIESTEVED
jgi:hypothetical protein